VVIPWRDNRRGGGGEGEIAVLVPSSSSSSSTVENDVNGRPAFEVSLDGAEDDNCRGREPPAPPPSNDSNDNNVDDVPPPPLLLSHLDHLLMASRVAPLWFLSNYS
jgi:hypothetical protein